MNSNSRSLRNADDLSAIVAASNGDSEIVERALKEGIRRRFCYWSKFSNQKMDLCVEPNLPKFEENFFVARNLENKSESKMRLRRPHTTLYCFYCDFSTKRKKIINRHMDLCVKKPISEIEEDFFMNPTSGNISLRTVELQKTYKTLYCHYCNFSTTKKTNIRWHVLKCLKRVSKLKQNNHFYIDVASTDASQRTVELHKTQKLFYCHYCNFSTIKKAILSRHVVLCMKRNLSRFKKYDYYTSQRTHKVLYCYYCNFSTKRKPVISQHVDLCMKRTLYGSKENFFIDTTSRNISKRNIRLGRTHKKLYCHHCNFSTKRKKIISQHVDVCMKRSPSEIQENSYVDTTLGYMSEGTHATYRKLYCYYCNFTTKRKPTLRWHVVLCMEKSLSRVESVFLDDTDLENTPPERVESLKNDSGTHTKEIRISCTYCNYRASKAGISNSEFRSEMTEKFYHCIYCDYNPNQGGFLRKLLSPHIEDTPFLCSYCGYMTSKEGFFNRHMRTHTGGKLYHCTRCDYKASTEGILKRHLRGHSEVKPSYTCGYCQYTAKQRGHLKQHLRIHTGEKPFSCSHCDYKTTTTGRLKSHLRTHAGEKPYSCYHCNYTASAADSLRKHLRTHTDQLYACTYCEYTTYERYNLMKHLKIHTEEKSYSCGFCVYKARLPRHLKEHLRTHTGEKPYSCGHCDYTTRAARSLKKHLKTHTEDTEVKPHFFNYQNILMFDEEH